MRVQANNAVKVLDGPLKLAQVVVGYSPVIVYLRQGLVDVDGPVQVFNGSLVFCEADRREATVVVVVGIFGVQSNSLIVVLDCPLMLT